MTEDCQKTSGYVLQYERANFILFPNSDIVITLASIRDPTI